MNSLYLAWLIRRHALEMTTLSRGSHIGSVLSAADILAVLYSGAAKVNPKAPKDPDRDRVILSKGHAGAAIYAALAESGFFDPKILTSHYANGSILSGHVSHIGVPGVELSTGSLGHGLPVGMGMALALKRDGRGVPRVFVICGDGECDEGSIWESALIARHYGLSNLTAIIDHNKMQSLDFCENTIQLTPFSDKWRAFGWRVVEADGHDHAQLESAFASMPGNAPTVVIAHTTKGKGISFMEDNIVWHYRYAAGDEYTKALTELHATLPDGLEDPYEM